MSLQAKLNELNMTKYTLSKISGIPKTTILDLCAGRSAIERCSAKTVWQLAKALNLSMEDIMLLDTAGYGADGLPSDKSYHECGLPEYLSESLEKMKATWAKLDRGEKDYHWDCDYCELQADINSAEVNGEISCDTAWYLREKYLRIERPGEVE